MKELERLDYEHTRLLLYVIGFYELHHRGPTYDVMAIDTGRSRESIHRRMLKLRDWGLVDWEKNCPGTLRPLVGIVG